MKTIDHKVLFLAVASLISVMFMETIGIACDQHFEMYNIFSFPGYGSAYVRRDSETPAAVAEAKGQAIERCEDLGNRVEVKMNDKIERHKKKCEEAGCYYLPAITFRNACAEVSSSVDGGSAWSTAEGSVGYQGHQCFPTMEAMRDAWISLLRDLSGEYISVPEDVVIGH